MQRQPITLAGNTIDGAAIGRLIDWLQTSPRLTKGPITDEFERRWAVATDARHAVFVNSGSSANLLMLYALKVAGRLRSDRIVVPSVAWATDLSPALQLGMEPVLVDTNLENLGPDVAQLERIFMEEKPAAFLLVSVLGLPPDMEEIVALCSQHDVILLEDVCESLGSRYMGRLLGTFGLMSSFSLYYGHHLSTIEGGMVCTDDDELHNLLKMLRSHGWDRDLNPADQTSLRKKWRIDDFDALYTFYVPGFNLRATDLQAYLGLDQLDRMDYVVRQRNANYHLYQALLGDTVWVPTVLANNFVSNFAYPVIHPRRDAIVQRLVEHDVQTRPLICGSMGTQPFYVDRFGRRELPNASIIDRQGCYVPNNHQLTTDEIQSICGLIHEAVERD